MERVSLRKKRFRLVSEQIKIEERDFRSWPREKWTLVPPSLLQNSTETLMLRRLETGER